MGVRIGKAPSRFYAIILLVVFLNSATGCIILKGVAGRYKYDVTDDPAYWGGYELGTRFETKVDLFLLNLRFYGKRVAAAPQKEASIRGRYIYRSPTSIQEFREVGRTGEYSKTVGVLEQGTRIEITRITKIGVLGVGSSVIVFSKILDGPLAGREIDIVDLSRTASSDDDRLLLRPNRLLIVEIEDS